MNPDVKEKWLDALRSGEYTQGKGVLQVDGNFCCLGVLCDLALKDGVDLEVKDIAGFKFYNGEDAYLPEAVQVWADLPRIPGVPTAMEADESLASVNDGGASFDEIADLIEENL